MVNKKKAAALTYDKNYIAPVVSARGVGLVADNIIKKAEESEVPVIFNKEMADLLCSTDIGDYIPEELYEAAAEIFVFIINIDEKLSQHKSE